MEKTKAKTEGEISLDFGIGESIGESIGERKSHVLTKSCFMIIWEANWNERKLWGKLNFSTG